MFAAFPLLAALAAGDTRVGVDAVVAPDLRTITGRIAVEGDPCELIDPLAALPIPTTDEAIQATFPGAVSRGAIQWSPDGDGWRFTSTLPRRYGDVGSTSRHGLFANGGWYPQPMVDGHLPAATSEVTVTLPAGTAGALGDVVGSDTLHWEGRGERTSLAVLPHGVVTPIDAGTVHLDLLTRGRPRAVLGARP